ncbi:MAG: hypothetical protein GAK35_01058 [Herbaspirillum frisingense]|uniref:Uncharacterized protein n=1 Tax=Herbaspirillum frisingense TaxID=92645 RepID=A0A7V8JVH9_9BURK|nr:MAG: hypothetical protein GAK35_01058 [Herbaspirillum frisingense]
MTALTEHGGAAALAEPPNANRMSLAELQQHLNLVQNIKDQLMKQDVHYGHIAGSQKPTLFKPGAEMLALAFRIADGYDIEDLSSHGHVRYRVICTGTHLATHEVLGVGMGEASSEEEFFAWRDASAREFDAAPEEDRRERQAWGDGGADVFVLQVRTNPADVANSILKVASKRAKTAMVLNVTASSDCFTQDLEDMPLARRSGQRRDAPEDKAPQKPAASAGRTQPGFCDQATFDRKKAGWRKAVESGKPPQDLITMIQTKEQLSDEQKREIQAWAPTGATTNEAA